MNEVSVTITSVDKTSAGFNSANAGATKVEASFKAVTKSAGDVTVASGKAGSSLREVGSSAEQMASAATRSTSSLGAMSSGLDSVAATTADESISRVATHADNMDSTGERAAGSLGALASGFELVGAEGSTAATAVMSGALAFDFWSGAGQAATLITEKFGKAIKGAIAFLGPWGIAFLAAAAATTAVVVALNMMDDEAKKAAEQQKKISEAAKELTATLDEQRGSITESSREWAYNRLAQAGVLEQMDKMGISARKAIDATLGNATAFAELSQEIDKHRDRIAALIEIRELSEQASMGDKEAQDKLNASLDKHRELLSDTALVQDNSRNATDAQTKALDALEDEMTVGTAAIEQAKRQWQQHTDAVSESTEATEGEIKTLEQLADTMRAQTDPLFALIEAQRDLKEAQDNYSEAVKKSGKNSDEANAALTDLAQAAINMSVKAGDVSASFDGKLTPAMRKVLQSAGLSKDEIARLENELRKAKAAADKLDGTVVNVTTNYRTRDVGTGTTHKEYAHGGITGAASGRIAGGLTMAGEHGPELLDLPPGTNVNSNPDTMRILENAMNGGGSGVTINLYVQGSIRSDRDIVALIRNEFMNGGFRGVVKTA